MKNISELIETNQSLITLVIFTLVVFYVGSFFSDAESEEIQVQIDAEEEIVTLLEEIESIRLDVEFSNNLNLFRDFAPSSRPSGTTVIGQSNPFAR